MQILRLTAITVALAVQPPALAEQLAARIAITSQSDRAAIIIKAPLLPVPPRIKSAYRINLQVYDPVAQQMQGGLLGGSLSIAANPRLFAEGYLVTDIKPGTYAFASFSRQDWWILCYQDNSLQFTIRPGEVLYLGAFDAAGTLVELSNKAMTSGRTSTQGAPVDFFDDVAPPAFAPIDAADLAAAAAMAKAAMLGTDVMPKPVAFTPARFGTGSTLFGGRRCGGYFQAKAK